MRHPISLVTVVIGSVGGLLVAALLTVAIWLLLTLFGYSSDPLPPSALVGAAAGLVASGYIAGRLALPVRTNALLAALGAATVITAIALLSGSPAGSLTIAGFVILAVLLGRFGGFLAGRHR